MVKELKKNKINITTDEYAKLSEYLQQFQYPSQITKDFKIGDKVISASTLRGVVEKTTDALFEGGNIHSELVVLNPKVKALVARVSSIEECSQEFIELAQQNNLPIILIGFKNGM